MMKLLTKGILIKKENDWFVNYQTKNTIGLIETNTIPIIQDDINNPNELIEGEEIEFIIIKKYLADQTTINAKIITEPKYNKWENIFQHVETQLNIDLPIRLKNWLTNNFNPPTNKNNKTC